MSANTINNNSLAELPIYTVHGVNWQIDIPLDEFNAQFSPEMQAMEAATKAIAIFKGKGPSDMLLKMDEGEDQPFLGPTMLVHLKNTDPTKGFIPFSHVILANDGYYKESWAMAKELEKELQSIAEEEQKNEKFQQQVKEQAALFEEFKKAMAEAKTKASPTKKSAAKKKKKKIDKPPSS